MIARSLSLIAAAALVATPGFALAATHKPMHHTMSHRTMSSHHSMSRSTAAAGRSTPSNADHSADSLNAQSLARSQASQ